MCRRGLVCLGSLGFVLDAGVGISVGVGGLVCGGRGVLLVGGGYGNGEWEGYSHDCRCFDSV